MRLASPYDVILRAGLSGRPECEDVSPMLDSAGFYTFRRYPPSSDLARVITRDGRPAVRCYLAFIVQPPKGGSTVSRYSFEHGLRVGGVRGAYSRLTEIRMNRRLAIQMHRIRILSSFSRELTSLLT
jgi:hypothetical protein